MAKLEKIEQSTLSALDERLENLKKMFPECHASIHAGGKIIG